MIAHADCVLPSLAYSLLTAVLKHRTYLLLRLTLPHLIHLNYQTASHQQALALLTARFETERAETQNALQRATEDVTRVQTEASDATGSQRNTTSQHIIPFE